MKPASVVGRSPAAARQLASRGRRRVQGAPASPDADRVRQREVIDAFLTASRQGDFSALLALLDPKVVLRADAAAVAASVARASLGVPPLMSEILGHEASRSPSLAGPRGRNAQLSPALPDWSGCLAGGRLRSSTLSSTTAGSSRLA
jgi:RNA polymerase sigma-70 factor (ECF subfamily)